MLAARHFFARTRQAEVIAGREPGLLEMAIRVFGDLPASVIAGLLALHIAALRLLMLHRSLCLDGSTWPWLSLVGIFDDEHVSIWNLPRHV